MKLRIMHHHISVLYHGKVRTSMSEREIRVHLNIRESSHQPEINLKRPKKDLNVPHYDLG